MGLRVRLLEEQDSRMKLLSWPCLLVSCLALTEALDFKHFPVVAGSPPSARTGGREVSAQVRPPGNRESVQQVTSTTQRTKVNRRRNKSRSRKISSAGEKTVAPVRAQTRTRTQVPRQQVQVSRQQIPASREQTPAPRRQIPATRQQTQAQRIETPTTRQRPTDFEAIERGQTATKVMPVDFPVIPPVVQQSFDPDVASSIPQQRVPAPKLTPIVQSQQPSQTFSQSLIEFFQPTISPNRNQVTGEKQQGRFKEAVVQPSRQDVARFQDRPSPLRVFTKNEPRAPQTQSFQPVQTQSFQSQPQQVSAQLRPERRKPIQRQPFKTQPIQQQQIQSNRASPVQAPKIQQQSVQQPQFQSINAQNIQLRPFQDDPFQGEAFHQTLTFKTQAPNFQAQIPPFQAREPARQTQAPAFQARAPAFQARAPDFQAQQPAFQAQSPAFQAQGQALQPQAPTFQERPSLFSTPIDVPQPNGDGASFSFEAFVG